jgi:hypothetical protein
VLALRLLSASKPVKLDNIMCFDTLLMTATFSKLDNREVRMRHTLGLDLASLRRRIPRMPVAQWRVVLSENLWNRLEFQIKNQLPQVELVRLNATDDNLAGHIGDHISSIIHILWLNANETTVFGLTHQDYACNRWAPNMAQRIGVGYRAFTGN